MPQVNLSKVQVGFDAFAPGRYPVNFTNFQNKKNKNREDMITVEFTVEADADAYANRKAWTNFNLNEKGYPFLKMFLLAIGVPIEVLDDEENDFDTDEVLTEHKGAPCTIVVGTPGEYQGRETTNITRVEPPVLVPTFR